MLVLAAAGEAIAAYLTWVHYAGLSLVCLGSHACEVVQSSRYATVAGVPVALIGLIGYALIFPSLLVPGENGRLLTVLLTLGGFFFSAYLTYLELSVIHAICQWCVASALVVTVLAALACFRSLRPGGEATGPAAPDGASTSSS